VLMRLHGGAYVEVADPSDSSAWDLGFRRFLVKSNGGVSGTGGVRIAPLEGVAFDDVTEPPSEGWPEDAEDSDLDGHPDYVISGRPGESWFQYNLRTHVLDVADTIWVIEAADGRYFKLLFASYYRQVDGNEESGFSTFLWAPLQSDDPDSGDAGVFDDAGDAG
jgi:hypothetical protein